jgi:hypothetical protein
MYLADSADGIGCNGTMKQKQDICRGVYVTSHSRAVGPKLDAALAMISLGVH